MDDADSPIPQRRPWPPRKGQGFFLLWLGITIAGAIMYRAISFAVVWGAGAGAPVQIYWGHAITALVTCLAEGWLLFRRGPRMVLWTLLPLAQVGVASLASRDGFSPRWATYIGFASIGTIVVASIILTGVRRRAWLWLFIRLGLLVLTQLIYLWAFRAISDLDPFAVRLNDVFDLRSPFSLSGGLLFQAGTQGVVFLGNVLSAAALAWWMPPVEDDLADEPASAQTPDFVPSAQGIPQSLAETKPND